jgi:predicted peroxiredoxin
MGGKVLINCAAGQDDPERATVAFIAASAAAANEKETAMFLTCDAIGLATKDGVNGIEAPGYQALAFFRDSLMENAGKLWVCPACAAAHGLSADDLIDGAEIAGVPKILAYIDSGAVTLM